MIHPEGSSALGDVVGHNNNVMVGAILICEHEELRMDEIKEIAIHRVGPLTADVQGSGCSGTNWTFCLCQFCGPWSPYSRLPRRQRPLGRKVSENQTQLVPFELVQGCE